MNHLFIWGACPRENAGSGCTLQVRPYTPLRTSGLSAEASAQAGFSLPSITHTFPSHPCPSPQGDGCPKDGVRASILFIFLLLHINLFAQKELSFTDKVYEPQIKTVQLYPDTDNPQDFLQPSTTPIHQQTLTLEFDDLQDNRNNYYAKLIHCNYDWTKSQLMDLDFLENYNEYNLTDYSFSNSTYSRYVHYRFKVPPVKITGNYLLIVYRDDQKDLILSKRMMVFDTQIGLTKDDQMLGTGTLNRANQQFNFILNYGDIQVINPVESIHVNMRQNQRWDNAKINLQPSSVRDADSELDYRFMDDSWQFNGGNEFRFADFRSLNYPGQNTGRLNKSIKPYELYLGIDAPRGESAYAQYKDLDGNFVIDNLDYGEPQITGNYLYVNFTLKCSTPYNENVYVVGKFNDYQRSEESKIRYNTSIGAYESRQFVKQGWYDYQYVLESKTHPLTTIEGSHYETENVYEIAIYYRPFRPNADLLIGYTLISVNPR
ncbi:MAG: DUF5103 domain-containing protein [Bacteroidetes bacterium]|nr:DUF5103 domain-containing protein [Bacteroidota bacterium]